MILGSILLAERLLAASVLPLAVGFLSVVGGIILIIYSFVIRSQNRAVATQAES